jgi:KUP system potassium uptake protein
VIFIALAFRSSTALASAYGIAVTGTMIVTTTLALIVVWRVWNWSLTAAVALIVPFLLVDFTFLFANLLKVAHGGWVPLLIGGFLVVVMLTWREGASIIAAKTRRTELPIDALCRNLAKNPPYRVPGTAVFLTAEPTNAPTSLLHSLKHYKVLHEKNVMLTVIIEGVPRVSSEGRMQIEHMNSDFTRVLLRFGFMESPNVPKALALARKEGLGFEIMSTSFFLSRRSVRMDARSGKTTSSSFWQRMPMMRAATFSYPPTESWKSGRRLPSNSSRRFDLCLLWVISGRRVGPAYART